MLELHRSRRRELRKRIVVAVVLWVLFVSLAYAQTEDFFFADAMTGTPQSIQFRIDKGVNLEARDGEGWTAIMLASAYNPDPEVINVLVAAGALLTPRDRDGRTCLMMAACYSKNPKVITALLRAGADLGARTADDYTALLFAAANQNPDIFNTLLKAGADLNVHESMFGWTPLMYAVIYNPNLDVIAAILQAGADINAKCSNGELSNFEGMTALMLAAERSNSAVLMALLKAGADAKLKDKQGKTAFDYAQNLKGTDVYWKLNDARF